MANGLSFTCGGPVDVAPCRIPAVGYLDPALEQALPVPAVAALAASLSELGPALAWYRRPPGPGEAPGFRDGHANAWIVGPGGLELHDTVAVGVSLLAPHVVYPVHQHPPPEIYIVMSEGEWFTEETGWHRPGIGGRVYHPANRRHAMRSGDVALLAIWCLWIGD